MIEVVVTRTLSYKGDLPARNHVFYIAKLQGKGGKAELRYSIAKDLEKEKTVKGVKELIVKELETKLSNDNPPN